MTQTEDSNSIMQYSDESGDEEVQVEPPVADAARLPSRQKPAASASIKAEEKSGSSHGLLVGGALLLVGAGIATFLLKKVFKKGQEDAPKPKRAATPTRSPARQRQAAAARAAAKPSPAKPSPAKPSPRASPQPATPAAVASPRQAAAAPAKPSPSSGPRLPQRPAPATRTSPAAKAAPAAKPAPAASPAAKAAPASSPAAKPAPAASPAAKPAPATSSAAAPAAAAPKPAAPAPVAPSPAPAVPKPAPTVEVPAPPEAALEPEAPSPAAAAAATPSPATPAAAKEPEQQAEQEEAAAMPAEAPAAAPAANGEAAQEASQPEPQPQPQQQQQEQQQQQAQQQVAPKAKAAKPKEPEQVEHIEDYPVSQLSFEGCPAPDAELTELEQKARSMSIHANKLLQGRNLAQAVKEQRAALEMLIAPQAVGQARPTLVVSCALALADMTLAQRQFEDTKKTLALAYSVARQSETTKGHVVHCLMNYAFVVKGEVKPQSAQAAYEAALEAARSAFGPLHPHVEKVKYELIAHLINTDQESKAVEMLLSAADELLVEGDRLEKEEKEKAEQEQQAQQQDGGEKAAADGGAAPAEAQKEGEQQQAASGEPAAEGQAQQQEEEQEEPPASKMARHFAVRNLMNAAGVMDNQKQFEKGNELLQRALEVAVANSGPNSIAEMNVLTALAQHYRRREMWDESIDLYERVLGVMDERIQVYDPETLRERIALLRDMALLLKTVGRYEEAIDFATGALVNCQALLSVINNGRPVGGHPMLEQFHLLLADLKQQVGDEEGAAEARRAALQGRLSVQQARGGGRGGRGGGRGGQGGRGGKRSSGTGAATTRAGGRRH